jgi:hypothetical protein
MATWYANIGSSQETLPGDIFVGVDTQQLPATVAFDPSVAQS